MQHLIVDDHHLGMHVAGPGLQAEFMDNAHMILRYLS